MARIKTHLTLNNSLVVTIPAEYIKNVFALGMTTNTTAEVTDDAAMLHYFARVFECGDDDARVGRFFDKVAADAINDGEGFVALTHSYTGGRMKIDDRIENRLKRCAVTDGELFDLLSDIQQIMAAYRFIVERKVLNNQDEMTALETWAPGVYKTIMDDLQQAKREHAGYNQVTPNAELTGRGDAPMMIYIVMVQHMLIGAYSSKSNAEKLVAEWSAKDGLEYSIFEQVIDEGDV